MTTIAAIKLSAQTATTTVAALHAWGDLFWELLAYLDYCKGAIPGQRAFFMMLQDYLFEAHIDRWSAKMLRAGATYEDIERAFDIIYA